MIISLEHFCKAFCEETTKMKLSGNCRMASFKPIVQQKITFKVNFNEKEPKNHLCFVYSDGVCHSGNSPDRKRQLPVKRFWQPGFCIYFTETGKRQHQRRHRENVEPGIYAGSGLFYCRQPGLGVQFSVNSARQEEDGDKYTETTTMLLPFVRLYFGKSNVKSFVQAGVGPGWEKWGYSNNKETENLVGYEFDGGLAVFISPNISLDFILGYGSATA